MQKTKTLDPVLLGRPLQAFDALSHVLSHQVAQHLERTGHRHLSLHIEQAQWLPLHAGHGAMADQLQVHFERASVLQLMAVRYGFTYDEQDLPATRSSTELRLTESMEQAVLQALRTTLHSQREATPKPSTQRWQWQAQIAMQGGAPALLRLELDAAHSAQLEAWVQAIAPTKRSAPSQPETLMVELHALLLEKTVTAADIQQLRVGSVLPIHLERARVTLNEQAMLTATVAEHLGKLHLTAFETLE